MAAQASHSPTGVLPFLEEKNVALTSQFQRTYPELHNWIKQEKLLNEVSAQFSLPTTKVQAETLQLVRDEQEKKMMIELTQEEHSSIMQKMQDFAQLPKGTLDSELELYLEQQLSEMLGFSVSTELEGQRLPTTGTVYSLPFLKNSPTDTVHNHLEVPEAPFINRRSFFGWSNLYPQITHEPDLLTYGLSIPLFSLPDWSTKAKELKKWYAYRKVVVINPYEYRAVVATITDTFFPPAAKYKYGANPALIRAGRIWSPRTLGKVLVFFVSDPAGVPPGPISLEYE